MNWDELIANVVPFVLLIGFWLILMRRVRSGANPTVEKLEEIRAELELIRRALEGDPFGRR